MDDNDLLNVSMESMTLSEISEGLKPNDEDESTPESPSKRGKVNDVMDIAIEAPTSFGLDGNKFSRKEKPKFNPKLKLWVTYYNCSLRRSTDCKARCKITVEVDDDGNLISIDTMSILKVIPPKHTAGSLRRSCWEIFQSH